MGNCLVSFLRKSEGKVLLHYPPEVRVHEANLPEFSSHAVISSELQNSRHLDQVKDNEVRHERGVVRIKVVISKQELKEMIRKGGVDDQILSQLLQFQRNQSIKSGGTCDTDCCKGWKPVLESIPEGNDQHFFCLNNLAE